MIEQLNKDTFIRAIGITLDNTKTFDELFNEMTFREYLDMYIHYCVFTFIGGRFVKHRLTKKNLEELDIDDEELFKIALSNTMRMFPPKIERLDYVIERLMDGCYPFTDEEDMPCSSPLYYLGNESGRFGSSVILYDNILEQIYDMIKQEYYLIPSSVDEYLFIPDSEVCPGPEFILDMVKLVNSDVLTKDKVLSDSIYHYCHKSKNLTVLSK
jgi:hypothetical protein